MAWRLAAAAALLVAAWPAAAQRPVPALTGPVVDEAGVLDAESRRALQRLCLAARAQEGGEGVQLQYLVVRSLQGEPIESFSIRAAEAWKIGSKGRDNGVLVVVAIEDRAVRIEVGGGLEGSLTDAQAGRIIRGTLAPAFGRGAFGEGLLLAGEQILGTLGAPPSDATRWPVRRRGVVKPGLSLLVVAFVLMVLLVRVVTGFGPRRRRWWWGPPYGRWGGGGWSGGGFGGGGGGGWSGGGGGFSGGGASGRW